MKQRIKKKKPVQKPITKPARNKATRRIATPSRSAKAASTAPSARRGALRSAGGPVTLEEARVLARVAQPRRAGRRSAVAPPSPASVGEERERLERQRQQENAQRAKAYEATLEIMDRRGVAGLPAPTARPTVVRAPAAGGRRRRRTTKDAAAVDRPLQILAEGDSWFDYPIPLFGGGIVPRLEDQLGVPILNRAAAGDEVRFMLGVKQRRELAKLLEQGGPLGAPWDVLLFSGGGNDIVDNPMALWVRQYDSRRSASSHIHRARFDAALALVRAGYEDLIELRDALSPDTHLVFHAYDFAIPDGRGICHLGPWLKPTFDLRGFPSRDIAGEVVKVMLAELAAALAALASAHSGVSFVNGQGTLAPQASSWHNELHPSRAGFAAHATLFANELRALFPARVPRR